VVIIVILGVLGLSFLVLLHELGHFIAAKSLKIPVEIFSIGFGKPLLKKTIGETEYRIAPFLFGGFIKMEGDEPGKPSETGFNSRPVWHRATVAIAGPAVNLITAFLFLLLMFLTGTRYNAFKDSTKVGFVLEASPSYGYIYQNDSITSINGKVVSNWDQVDMGLRDYSSEHTVELIRDGKSQTVTFTIPVPDADSLDKFQHGLEYFWPAVIGEVSPGGAAQQAGLLPNDTIREISGSAVTAWYDVPLIVGNYSAEDSDMESEQLPLSFVVSRESGIDTIAVTPLFNSEYERYLIGISAREEQYLRKYSLGKSLALSGLKFKEYSTMIFSVLGKLGTRQVPIDHLAGPLTIILMFGSAAQAGVSYLLNFMAMISINLGIINLMPLVITDGGILLFLLIELIIKKPVPEKVQQNLSLIFVALFLTLFIVISYSDITDKLQYFIGG